MNLAEYQAAKFELADIVRAAVASSGGSRSDAPDAVRDVFSRLAEDRFNLVVVGRFNRGKTSLMNALLATDRLPTGIVPLTSVITAVAYGTRPEAFVRFQGNRQLASRIALAELRAYVTQDGNPGNEKQVAQVTVRLPNDLLRNGLYVVDTPGIGSAIGENTATTERFLPEADAFVLVTSYESPLSQEEIDLLRRIVHATPVFVVLNKRDTVTAAERAQVDRFVHDRLAASFGAAAPPVFSVSALADIRPVGAADSGVPAFRDALIRFLLDEKRRRFLANMTERVAAIIQIMPDSAAPAERLAALRARLGHDSAAGPVAAPEETDAADFVSCDICDAVERRMFDHLARYQYDLTIDAQARDDLVHRGGLCAVHTWQYYKLASPQGVCLAFPAVLDELQRRLRDSAARCGADFRIDGLPVADDDCGVCRCRRREERLALDGLKVRLAASGETPSLCLPHAAMVARQIDDAAAGAAVLRTAAQRCARVAENMRRYALKFDGTKRHLATDAELNAARAALTLLVGSPHADAGRHDR